VGIDFQVVVFQGVADMGTVVFDVVREEGLIRFLSSLTTKGVRL